MQPISHTFIWKERAKVAALLLACVLLAVLSVQVATQPKLLSRSAGAAVQPVLAETTGTIKDIHGSIKTIGALTGEIKQDYENNQANLAANSEAVAVLLKQLTDIAGDTHTQLFGGQDCRPTIEKLPNGWRKLDCKPVPGLFPQTSLLLEDAHSWMTQLKSDTHELMTEAGVVLESTDAALKPLKDDLLKLGTLEDDLDKAIRAGSQNAGDLANKTEKILDDVDAQLRDEKIQSIISNLNKTTYHLGEQMQTFDEATRGLRRAAGKVKWVLQTIGNYFKATVRIY